MDSEAFCKKLAFTIESVRRNGDNVSGVIDLGERGYIIFDNTSIEFNDMSGVTILSDCFSSLSIDEFIPVLRALNCSIVVRVYPDCC